MGKTYTPNWDAIVKILDTPRQEAVIPRQGLVDGAVEESAGPNGLSVTKLRVAADVGKHVRLDETSPTGFVFVCECGHARRVIPETERTFRCERPGETEADKCQILWRIAEEETGDFDEYGREIKKPKLQEHRGKGNRKYLLPIITGRPKAEVVREEMARRARKGEETYAQPQGPSPNIPLHEREEPVVVPDDATPEDEA